MDLLSYQGNVRSEGVGCESKFDELAWSSVMDPAIHFLLHTFFCSISFAFGQSYTTSFPKTGVVSGLYIFSALTSLSFPLSMNSFPFTPKQTVVFFPSKTKVKMSPYWTLDQSGFVVLGNATLQNLVAAGEKEGVGIDSIGDGTTNERYPVEDKWGLIGVLNQ